MKTELKPCPFCGAVPKYDKKFNLYRVSHEQSCYLFYTCHRLGNAEKRYAMIIGIPSWEQRNKEY